MHCERILRIAQNIIDATSTRSRWYFLRSGNRVTEQNYNAAIFVQALLYPSIIRSYRNRIRYEEQQAYRRINISAFIYS